MTAVKPCRMTKKSSGKKPELFLHTEDRNRTDMELPPPDFESGASTSSATPAERRVFATHRPHGQ